MTGFTRENGCLMVDGLSLDAIAAKYGTPLYVYSGAGIAANFIRYQNAVSGADSHVHFALKANSNLAVLRLLATLGAGADIVSGGEMRRALAAGIPANKIIFSGVAKTDDEIRDAITIGIGQINAESSAEVDAVIRIATAIGRSIKLALRVNPNVDAGTHAKIATGKNDTKFGISMEDCPHIYRRIAASTAVEVGGLAVHIGSQIMRLEPFEDAWRHLLTLAEALVADGLDVPCLDLGGGVGIDYHTGQHADIDGFGALITRLFGKSNFKLGFEPGRFITAEAGVLLTKVIYTKDVESKQFIIIDAAMNDFLRPTLYEAYHRIEPILDLGANTITADIVGPVCETGDYLGLNRKMPQTHSGDLLAVMSAGAYGAVMRSSYNTRPPAAEVLVLDGTAHLVSSRLTVDDLLNLDHIPDVIK